MARYDATSRYEVDTDGQHASRRAYLSNLRYITYTVKEGDTLESIATRHLGNPLRFWEIADANPQVKFPLDITTGTVLRLPL